MTKKHFAHSLPDKPTSEWQPLLDHLEQVAARAEKYAEKFQSPGWALNAAWLHDIGKLADEFQDYLLRENSLNDEAYDGVTSARVNHSSAGAALAEEIYGPVHSLPIAYLVAGHHAGLPDYFPAHTGRAALKHRLEEGKKNLDRIRDSVNVYVRRLHQKLQPPAFVKAWGYHIWIRMLFSCLVDADFLDTEQFMNPVRSQERSGYPPLSELKPQFDHYMSNLQKTAESSPVNSVRREILALCKDAALQTPGLFTLSVPTGGGKTLSSMAFALDHAVNQAKNRIIYVIPYTSIIEQTADIFSNIFGIENVVEHHSNLEPDKETQRSRLAAENWDAPIIVTTNVQFLESLHAAKSSRCRKLHNIINSVVIFDEAQLLPAELLEPCIEAMNQLVNNYSVSMVLSTATQPALPRLCTQREIIADPGAIFQKLRRTKIWIPSNLNHRSGWQDIAERVKQHQRVLCIVNTRRDCFDLHKLMPKGTIHLSALMCGQHRSEILSQIKAGLKDSQTVRLISTQLVEAGVDIDFPVVFRALAGLDSIVQAAGRCNREGGLNAQGRMGDVHVFVPEKPSPRGLLLKGENTARELFAVPSFNPEHPDAFSRYFQLFYSKVNDTGRAVKELLQKDAPFVQFRTAAKRFKLIDDQDQQPVFVRYADSHQWLGDLRRFGPKRRILRRLQRYAVNISRRDFEYAKANGMVEQVWPEFWLWIGKYDNCYGLDLFGAGWEPQDLMV